jgi:hypothetical protein
MPKRTFPSLTFTTVMRVSGRVLIDRLRHGEVRELHHCNLVFSRRSLLQAAQRSIDEINGLII